MTKPAMNEPAENEPVRTQPAMTELSTVDPVEPDGDSTVEEPKSGFLARTPLRVKLVAVMLTLVALALIVISFASAFGLRSYLISRIDDQLANGMANVLSQPLPQVCPEAVVVRDSPSDYLVGISIPSGNCVLSVYDEMTYGKDGIPKPPGSKEQAVRVGQPYTASSVDHNHRWRLLVITLSNGQTVTVGEDLADVDSAMDRLVAVNLLVGTLVLVFVALAGVWLIRASLKPLVGIERTAGAIAGGDLTQRVPEQDPNTELGRLSRALNTMLTQIETAFKARAESEAQAVRSEEKMRQFVADASHELRTPLTSIRGFAELYRQGAAADPADVLRRIEDEAARMGLLVEDLLLLARLDEERPMRHAPVRLAGIINDAATAARAVSPEREIDVDIAEPAGGLIVPGDEARLRQVVGNLVTNALTHTPSGTPVALRLHADGETHAVIEVADRGPGLTPEQSERVFERFYRVDKARTRRAAGPSTLTSPHSGAGLGLAIVAALVGAHGGSVQVRSDPGQGAVFSVRLPLVTALSS
jgi:two-component system OmpR family sensor kinase